MRATSSGSPYANANSEWNCRTDCNSLPWVTFIKDNATHSTRIGMAFNHRLKFLPRRIKSIKMGKPHAALISVQILSHNSVASLPRSSINSNLARMDEGG